MYKNNAEVPVKMMQHFISHSEHFSHDENVFNISAKKDCSIFFDINQKMTMRPTFMIN